MEPVAVAAASGSGGRGGVETRLSADCAAGLLAALAIGATVALDALWGGPISGASMNPARSFGPALIAGAWQDHWVYWLGSLLGASLGAGVYQFLRTPLPQDSASAQQPQNELAATLAQAQPGA